MLATTPCVLCGSPECTVLFAAGVAQIHRIVRCDQCGLMRADPPPSEPGSAEALAYPDDPNFDVERERSQRCEKEALQVRDFHRTLDELDELHPHRGTLVEVGSGMGYLLVACRDDGWKVLGVEPDINGCKHSAKLGVEAIHNVLEEARLPAASADAVVMLHVIEHVPDPLRTLREIWRILKPGGHLVVETPRYDSLMFRLLGRRERSLRCDGHVFFYTVPTLRRSLEVAGFAVEHVKFPSRSLTLDRFVYNLAVIAHGGRYKPVDAARKAGLQRWSFRLNMRDIQRVLAVKPLRAAAAPKVASGGG